MIRFIGAAAAGLGGGLAIAILSMLSDLLAIPLLLAPFGASCVLVFGVPTSPFVKFRNIVGGYLISAAMGLLAVTLLGPGVAGAAVGVALAISAMMLTDTIHPPAGAVPIVVALTQPGLSFLLAPVGAGALLIVLLGIVFRRAPSWPVFHRIRQSVAPDRPGALR